jgi:hypothetical protein
MRFAPWIFLALFPVLAQSQGIDGYWQDIGGRTVFKRDVAPDTKYGHWSVWGLDMQYPHAKEIRKAGAYELKDLNFYDKDYAVKVLRATDSELEYVRTASWSPCRVHHACQQFRDTMLCTIENVCRVGTGDVVDSRGEELYIRRAGCERLTKLPEAQGIPVRCW